MGSVIPRFEPHPLLPNGHWQTIGGHFLPGKGSRLESRGVEIALPDNDRLRVEDSTPAGWSVGDPTAVLVHGLAGSARSPYMVRLATRLARQGIRVVRMNLRGAGEGFGLARGIYHAGKTGDVRAVAGWLSSQAPGSPVALIGFSLGGNLVLKLAAEAAVEPLEGFDCVLAANAPLDLAACCRWMRMPSRRVYDRNFVKNLKVEIKKLHAAFPDLGPAGLDGVESVYEFDDRYTAPRHGFAGADDYYARSSAGPLLSKITVPGLVVHAEDDPFIPVESYRGLTFPVGLALEMNPYGGHLGYISRTRWGGDRRWLDSRLSLWLADHWETARRTREGGVNTHVHHDSK
jgi:uncharacterized protein